MKYKIIILEIDPQTILRKNVYITEDERERSNLEDSRIDVAEHVDKETQIYEQTVSHEINLKGIIDAFNEQPIKAGRGGGGFDPDKQLV